MYVALEIEHESADILHHDQSKLSNWLAVTQARSGISKGVRCHFRTLEALAILSARPR